MNAAQRPRVSIGLPVYNGERFLESALESLLSQTFSDFELVISDNASCDGTQEICRSFAALDKRIRYVRNPENIGVFRNSNQVIALSSGEYFKMASHDDLCLPTFLEECVQTLDRHPTCVLAYTRAVVIDSDGNYRNKFSARPELSSSRPSERFRRALTPDETFPLFGVVRTAFLNRTSLFGIYPESDVILLAELTLYGAIHEIPEPLFLLREHPKRSVRAQDWTNPHANLTWWDPLAVRRVAFPEWRLLHELVAAVCRSPLGWEERCLCFLEAYRWMRSRRGRLSRDIMTSAEFLPWIGPAIGPLRKNYLEARWRRRLLHVANDVASAVPSDTTFILVDDAKFEPKTFESRRTIPFLEREGQYWGAPSDDQTAIQELERLRRVGARFIVFGWPAFWWLEFYADLNRYLRSRFQCVKENARVIIFDLRHERESTQHS